jgi:predicted membrane-bound spermidine synthase
VREAAAIAVLGGAAILGFEVTAARLVSPFYGQSFVVWTLVIALTLVGLTLGYWLGGRLADRFSGSALLPWVLLVSAAAVTLTTLLTSSVLAATRPLGLRLGAAAACALLVVPPMVAMGAIAPTLVRAAASDVASLGRLAGRLYAVSTVGSLAGAFAFGFGLLPWLGARGAALAVSFALLAALALHVARLRRVEWAPALAALAALNAAMLLFARPPSTVRDTLTGRLWTVVQRSEGLHGRIVVADLPEDPAAGAAAAAATLRYLFVDGIPQSYVFLPGNLSGAPYVHAMAYRAAAYPPGSRALLLGLGAGSLVLELRRLGIEVDAVEIDRRIEEVARRHFELPDDCRVAVDDARHHLLVADAAYDLILLDCFSGERIPGHLLTLEAFESMKRRLRPGGTILINYTGFVSGADGAGSRSIGRTLRAAGLRVAANGTDADESARNLIIAASAEEPALAASPSRANDCCREHGEALRAVPVDLFAEPARVLTDDRGELELLNVGYHERLRARILEDFPWDLLLGN